MQEPFTIKAPDEPAKERRRRQQSEGRCGEPTASGVLSSWRLEGRTGAFSFKTRAREGCPLSPPLSNAALGVLGRAAGQEGEAEGTHVGGEGADHLCVQTTRSRFCAEPPADSRTQTCGASRRGSVISQDKKKINTQKPLRSPGHRPHPSPCLRLRFQGLPRRAQTPTQVPVHCRGGGCPLLPGAGGQPCAWRVRSRRLREEVTESAALSGGQQES